MMRVPLQFRLNVAFTLQRAGYGEKSKIFRAFSLMTVPPRSGGVAMERRGGQLCTAPGRCAQCAAACGQCHILQWPTGALPEACGRSSQTCIAAQQLREY